MIGQILSSVTGLATSWLDSKAQQKLLETEIKKKQLTGEIDWELEAIRSAQNSWKDELWTIVFVCILAANFVPRLMSNLNFSYNKQLKLMTSCEWQTICVSFIALGLLKEYQRLFMLAPKAVRQCDWMHSSSSFA